MSQDKFTDINWFAPFDLQRYRSIVPEDAKVKTIFARDVVNQLQRRDKTIQPPKDLITGKDCSLRAYMTLLHDASKVLYPDQPPRIAMRQLGRSVFPTFVESLVGRVILGVMGEDVVGIIKLSNKAASATISTGEVAIVMAARGEAILHFRNIYLSDTYQVGVMEGMLDATRRRNVKVRLNSYSIDDVYMQLTWQDPPT